MIFVSYSEKDRALVEALVIELGVLGHSVYFEEKSLGGSQQWDEIFTSIEQSDAFVYTITANTQASYSRLLEFEHALALGKPIIALQLEDIDLWALPPGVPPIIPYQTQNLAVQAELTRILQSIPPTMSPTTPMGRPELSFALGQLYQRIHVADTNDAEKAALLLNLQEFLERRETYPPAESMLHDFADRIGTDDSLADEVQQTSAQLRRSHQPKSLLSRGRALKALFLLAVIGIVVWFIRNPPVAPILDDPAVTQETVANLLVERTVEVDVSSPQAAATGTSEDSPSLDAFSIVTNTPLPQPTATRQAPNTTLILPSATRQAASTTPVQPTATRQQPTNQPPTRVPPTQVPPTNQPPPTQPPPTQVSPTRVPPTNPPPTQPPPTQPPPTSAPVLPLPTLIPPVVATLVPPIVATLIPPVIATLVPPLLPNAPPNQGDNKNNQGNQGQGSSQQNEGNSGKGNQGSGGNSGNSGKGNQGDH